jgi:hypothetical protein
MKLDAQEYSEAREIFGRTALRLALLREALVAHGFSDELAAQLCIVWFQGMVVAPDDVED